MNKRIPRKKGQPAKSDKHSDLYTDEDPKGTIKGLGFKDKRTAALSVAKIKRSGIELTPIKLRLLLLWNRGLRWLRKLKLLAFIESLLKNRKRKQKRKINRF